jgi:hypothetical protein
MLPSRGGRFSNLKIPSSFMSFIIRPMQGPVSGNRVCCKDGKSPTEYNDPSIITEDSVVDNGDGTHTTFWTLDTTGTGGAQIYFVLCCVTRISIEWDEGIDFIVISPRDDSEGGLFNPPTDSGDWDSSNDTDGIEWTSDPKGTVVTVNLGEPGTFNITY